jgi:MFS family permease
VSSDPFSEIQPSHRNFWFSARGDENEADKFFVRIWGKSEDTINHSQAGNVFMLGPGGLATIILAAYFGRLPVLFYFVIFAFLTAAWCAAATTFESFMAARVLNGFFSTVAQGVSQMLLNQSRKELTIVRVGSCSSKISSSSMNTRTIPFPLPKGILLTQL